LTYVWYDCLWVYDYDVILGHLFFVQFWLRSLWQKLFFQKYWKNNFFRKKLFFYITFLNLSSHGLLNENGLFWRKKSFSRFLKVFIFEKFPVWMKFWAIIQNSNFSNLKKRINPNYFKIKYSNTKCYRTISKFPQEESLTNEI